MALKLPDSAVPMGDFPVAKAVDIDFDDGENLQEKLDNGKLGGAGGASTASEVSYSNEALSSVSDVKMALDTIVGEKANATDLTTHTGDANIHVTTTDKAKWDKVTDKLNVADFNTHKNNTDIHITKEEKDKLVKKTDITDTIDINSSGTKIPNVKAVYNDIIIGKDINQTVIDTYGTEILKYPIGIWRIGTVSTANKFEDLPVKTGGRIEITSIKADTNSNPWNSSWAYRVYNFETFTGMNYFRKVTSTDTPGARSDTGWKELATMDKVEELSSNLDELFQSVSDGKTLVANAITDKGVSTSTTATFATMATNVGKITNYTASEKQALATAITNKGVSTAADASFSTMATNVSKITNYTASEKQALATAITNKGVSTSSTASFSTMATNISKISGGYKEETINKTFSTTGISVLTFTFSANVLAIKQIIAPSDSCSILLQSSKNIFTINGKELIVHVTGSGAWKVTALIQN